MKLIVSGVPCSGKTYFGDWLRDKYDFSHANLEGRRTKVGWIMSPHYYNELPLWLATLGDDVVVTWGFPPNQRCFDIITEFKKAGFSTWWFTADRDIARRKYVERDNEGHAKRLFDPQFDLIQKAQGDLDALYGKNKIETLKQDGYVPLEEIYNILID